MPINDPEDVVEAIRKRTAALGGKSIGTIIIGVLLLFFVVTSWFTVQPEETGIVQRFGAVNRTVSPDLHFKFPGAIQQYSNTAIQ
jgi:membrane protease subunit HflK